MVTSGLASDRQAVVATHLPSLLPAPLLPVSGISTCVLQKTGPHESAQFELPCQHRLLIILRLRANTNASQPRARKY